MHYKGSKAVEAKHDECRLDHGVGMEKGRSSVSSFKRCEVRNTKYEIRDTLDLKLFSAIGTCERPHFAFRKFCLDVLLSPGALGYHTSHTYIPSHILRIFWWQYDGRAEAQKTTPEVENGVPAMQREEG